MKVVSLILVFLLVAAPVLAGEQEATDGSGTGRRAMFWSGIALGIAGVTMSVLGVTVARVEDSSSGNSPIGTYQACVAQKSNPIYATNNCDVLKGKNRPLLWGGAALGGVGAVLIIGGTGTSAQVSRGAVGLFHTIRF
jgi:hypothetical protein